MRGVHEEHTKCAGEWEKKQPEQKSKTATGQLEMWKGVGATNQQQYNAVKQAISICFCTCFSHQMPSHAINTQQNKWAFCTHETNNTRDVTQCHQATSSKLVYANHRDRSWVEGQRRWHEYEYGHNEHGIEMSSKQIFSKKIVILANIFWCNIFRYLFAFVVDGFFFTTFSFGCCVRFCLFSVLLAKRI